jgi:hypothetical protein
MAGHIIAIEKTTRSSTRGWKFSRLQAAIMISLALAGCGERVVDAPPPKVTFESSLIRILDVNVPAGATLRHAYPNGAAMVVMTDGTRMRMRPAGKDWGDDIDARAGSTTVAEAGEHGVRNVGERALQLLALENLRPVNAASASAGAAPISKGMTLIGESASLRAYEGQLTDTNTQITHTHTVPAVTILTQGKVLSQGPENKDKAIGDVASGLKQLDRPGQWVFVPAGGMHYVVRLGLDRSQIVEIELR